MIGPCRDSECDVDGIFVAVLDEDHRRAPGLWGSED